MLMLRDGRIVLFSKSIVSLLKTALNPGFFGDVMAVRRMPTVKELQQMSRIILMAF